MLSAARAGRIVARMGADLEQRRAGLGQRVIVAQRGAARSAPSAPSAEPAATGSVASAATSSAGRSPRRSARSKFAGISTANSTVPDASSRSNSAVVAHLMRDLEIARVLQRREDRAADVARLLQQHRGRQVARRGVDRVAEQDELHQRDHDDHRERDAVAAELDELLDQHRAGAARRSRAADRARGSLEIVLRAAHQVDEHVFERRLATSPRSSRGSSR